MYENLRKNVNQSEEKAEKCQFFSGSTLDGMDQDKIISCVSNRILHSVLNHFGNDIVSQ